MAVTIIEKKEAVSKVNDMASFSPIQANIQPIIFIINK